MKGRRNHTNLSAPSLWGLASLMAVCLAAAPAQPDAEAGSIARLVDSEELILALTPSLDDLAASVSNLKLPDHHSRKLFLPHVAVRDLSAASAPSDAGDRDAPLAAMRSWPLASAAAATPAADLALWRPLLDRVDYFANARFQFLRGEFSGEGRDRWEADLAFAGLARTRAGGWAWVRAVVSTRWSRRPLAKQRWGPGAWGIDAWRVASLSTTEGDTPLFADVTDGALPDASVRKRARGSRHEQLLLEFARKGEAFEKPHKYFRVKPTDWNPGLSAVDFDRDGHVDLYVMDRWGKNLLLRNRGDGTFEEVAAQVGLDIENYSSCAVFADFDNDGDADLFLGRTLERSLYLVNEDGRYVDRSKEWVSVELPALVTSVSAADVDRDGLLDVYFSTYAAELMDVQTREREESSLSFMKEFLPEFQVRKLARRWRRGHLYLDRAGPPNVLLLNRGGGRFGPGPQSRQLAVWRNTFQSTWGDFDGDGDPDLYVANDFAPNNLLRNDEGSFVDVTRQTRTADIGFGMGASWGDYDNDGRQDLYVTNMYSTAGRRITDQVPGLDPRLARMSRGNSLFRNRGDGFEKVSGLGDQKLQVEKAGWSWGGQFVDVDNDGYLDIYASSGFYTAPEAIRIRGADL